MRIRGCLGNLAKEQSHVQKGNVLVVVNRRLSNILRFSDRVHHEVGRSGQDLLRIGQYQEGRENRGSYRSVEHHSSGQHVKIVIVRPSLLQLSMQSVSLKAPEELFSVIA